MQLLKKLKTDSFKLTAINRQNRQIKIIATGLTSMFREGSLKANLVSTGMVTLRISLIIVAI